MSAWRAAHAEDLAALWPALRAARAFSSAERLREVHARTPWCIRVSGCGDALYVRPWRAHLDVLAIRGAFAPPQRMAVLLSEVRAVACAQGYGRVASPLVPASIVDVYVGAGLDTLLPVVALQAIPARLAHHLSHAPDVRIRAVHSADTDRLVELDAGCFSEFWHYGRSEFEEALSRERITVAEKDGEIVGYAACSLYGSGMTVGRLAVAPDSRRAGIGSSLLCEASEWSAEAGAAVLTLCTQEENAVSRSFYRRVGLIEVEEPYAVALGQASRDTQSSA